MIHSFSQTTFIWINRVFGRSGGLRLPPRHTPCEHEFQWLGTGRDYLQAQLEAIKEAKTQIELETYTLTDTLVGRTFIQALTDAALRGVKVRLLCDAFGSHGLEDSFFDAFQRAGGQFRRFNPLRWSTLGVRDHRKLLIVDKRIAFTGGCNLSDEYGGDGVTQGWRDGGIRVQGMIVRDLQQLFVAQWLRAPKHQWNFKHRRQSVSRIRGEVEALSIKPGFHRHVLKASLLRDIRNLRPDDEILITAAYFLPGKKLRKALSDAAQSGIRVAIILPGKSDVFLSRWAARGIYSRLLKSGIEIWEYQPQILHAKTFVVGPQLYIGSANLDPRSLSINFELMLKIRNSQVIKEAKQQFERDLSHCKQITLDSWKQENHLWKRMFRWLAWLFISQLDPWLSRRDLGRIMKQNRNLKQGQDQTIPNFILPSMLIIS